MRARETIWLFIILAVAIGIFFFSACIGDKRSVFGIVFSSLIIATVGYHLFLAYRGTEIFRQQLTVQARDLSNFSVDIPVTVQRGRVLIYFRNEIARYSGKISATPIGSTEPKLGSETILRDFGSGVRGQTITPAKIDLDFPRSVSGIKLSFRLNHGGSTSTQENILVCVRAYDPAR